MFVKAWESGETAEIQNNFGGYLEKLNVRSARIAFTAPLSAPICPREPN